MRQCGGTLEIPFNYIGGGVLSCVFKVTFIIIFNLSLPQVTEKCQ